MPCGGIYPNHLHYAGKLTTPDQPCWMCEEGNCTHFIEEWDANIHEHCIDGFLMTREGKVLLAHGHEVIR